MAKDDDSATTSKKGGFLSRMRVQAAARAANTTKLSSVTTNDTPVETPLASPIAPAQSPPPHRQQYVRRNLARFAQGS